MRIGLVQCVSEAGNITANLATVRIWAQSAVEEACDMLCFPEYALTGAPKNKNGAPACVCGAQTFSALSEIAEEQRLTLLVGGMRESDGYVYSSCIVSRPNGDILFLDKLHPGTSEKESLSAGRELRSFQSSDSKWRFSALLCNDWHQPWCSFLLAHQGARILFAPFSTPHKPARRIEIWRRFMPARAYDCRSFILACNRMRENGQGGGLAAWGPDGAELYSFDKAVPNLGMIDLPVESLAMYTAANNGMKDKDFPAELNKDAMRFNLNRVH
ncbi:MAG: nitrilase-related carbon-nitrogen hydrolase [Verrucomicrobiota bacterium]